MSERDWNRPEDPDEPSEGAAGSDPLARAAFGPRQRSPLATTIAILAAIAVIVSLLANVWTEVLWFDSVKLTSVFTTRLGAQLVLGIGGGLITAALVWSSLWYGYRSRPIYAPVTPQQDALDRYRAALEPLRRVGTIAVPLVVGLVSGLGASSQWETLLLWRNQQPFGVNDPHFGLDVGFFVFALPWWTFLVAFLSMAVILAALAAAFTHYVYGCLLYTSPSPRDRTRSRMPSSA